VAIRTPVAVLILIDQSASVRLVVEYEPRQAIGRLFDRLLLPRGIERAFQRTFAAPHQEFRSPPR
jgi:hypothetical protein